MFKIHSFACPIWPYLDDKPLKTGTENSFKIYVPKGRLFVMSDMLLIEFKAEIITLCGIITDVRTLQ